MQGHRERLEASREGAGRYPKDDLTEARSFGKPSSRRARRGECCEQHCQRTADHGGSIRAAAQRISSGVERVFPCNVGVATRPV
jgi:hypothetical protein